MFGMGCFWGAEKKFWQRRASTRRRSATPPGYTPNPTYREVCSGMTGHNEVVLVVFDPKVSYDALLKTFWENHDPTQGMRQGNDVGTQYRSGIYYFDARSARPPSDRATCSRSSCRRRGYGAITTEILAGARVLLRRGLSPAVPVEEPGRLLRPRRPGPRWGGLVRVVLPGGVRGARGAGISTPLPSSLPLGPAHVPHRGPPAGPPRPHQTRGGRAPHPPCPRLSGSDSPGRCARRSASA